MPGFSNVIDQVKQFWATRNGRQRAFLLGGAAATAILITVFARLISAPDYKPLFQDMDPADAQALATQLEAQNIPHQVSADGKTVSVPADKLDAARLQTASQGKPHSGRMGFEIFDKMSWGQTEFDEKVAYQRAMEGELERTIQTLSDVESARVHLVMPTDSVFLDRQRDAKASVILKLRHDGLSKDAVTAISRLVSGAVEGLRPEDVSIIDADSERSLGLGHDDANSGEGQEALLTQRLISTLEPVVGANAIRASVDVEYDRGSSEQSEEKYDPSVSALLSVQKTEDTAGGTVPAGVPGTATNVPTAKQPKPGSTLTSQNNQQSSTSENAQYGVNRIVVHTVTPAGRVQRITAALLVDDKLVKTVRNGKETFTRQPRSQAELNKIQELAEAAIGFDAKRGDTISVQDMSFEANAAEADLPPANWVMKVQKSVSDFSSVLRPATLLALFLLAYFLLVRPVQKHVFQPAPASTAQHALATANGAALPSGEDDDVEDNVNLRAARLKEQAFELVKQNPVETARAMQTWIRERR
jgi:flagellar M-ring protein FliF